MEGLPASDEESEETVMKRLAIQAPWILSSLLAASCAGAPVARRPEIPPPRLPPAGAGLPVAHQRSAADEEATRRWLEDRRLRSEETPPAPRSSGTTDEEATRNWLQQRIDYQNAVNPPSPPAPIQQIVEKPVVVERRVLEPWRSWDCQWRYPDPWWDDYGYPYGGYASVRHSATFPINTLFGAGFGYALGGRRHRGRGAAIGAGIGLLFDIGNAVR
ncbi:MAG: hypothetical protein Fur0037_26760 [Planctomycetota bacterium]